MSNYQRTSHRLITLALMLVITVSLSTAISAANCFDQTGCNQCCPACDHCCKLDAEMGETEKKCFEVETTVICIPRVVFPWQLSAIKSCFKHSCDSCDGAGCSNCVHNGAKTRKVKVLSSRKYKCPKCEYTWTAEKRKPQPCGGFCDAQFVDSMAADIRPWSDELIESSAPATTKQSSYTDPTSGGLESIQIESKN